MSRALRPKQLAITMDMDPDVSREADMAERVRNANLRLTDDETAEVFRRWTPQQRLAYAAEIWRFANRLLTAAFAVLNPDWSETDIRREIARRRMGEDVWNSLPDEVRARIGRGST